MPSPFPGMNPYLEAPELWAEVHSRLIVALAELFVEIADQLDDLLSRQYRVAVENQVYLSQDEEAILVRIPDVALMAFPPEGVAIAAATTAVAEPLTVELPALTEVQERYLEIREGATGTVITVLELLSPKNKRAGEGRDAYLQKRQQVLSSPTHLVEIDLLRSGEAMPMRTVARSPYRILISRSHERPNAKLYPFGVQQAIPVFPIPLRVNESEPLLDLQPLLHRVYDRARFELAIDYQQAPMPKLSADDQAWLQGFFRQHPSTPIQ